MGRIYDPCCPLVALIPFCRVRLLRRASTLALRLRKVTITCLKNQSAFLPLFLILIQFFKMSFAIKILHRNIIDLKNLQLQRINELIYRNYFIQFYFDSKNNILSEI